VSRIAPALSNTRTVDSAVRANNSGLIRETISALNIRKQTRAKRHAGLRQAGRANAGDQNLSTLANASGGCRLMYPSLTSSNRAERGGMERQEPRCNRSRSPPVRDHGQTEQLLLVASPWPDKIGPAC